MPDQVHIVKITYRSGVNGRVAVAFAKIPYGGMVELSDKLARLLAVKQIRWFRIDAAKPDEIERERRSLVRWLDALWATQFTTKIDLMA